MCPSWQLGEGPRTHTHSHSLCTEVFRQSSNTTYGYNILSTNLVCITFNFIYLFNYYLIVFMILLHTHHTYQSTRKSHHTHRAQFPTWARTSAERASLWASHLPLPPRSGRERPIVCPLLSSPLRSSPHRIHLSFLYAVLFIDSFTLQSQEMGDICCLPFEDAQSSLIINRALASLASSGMGRAS